VGSGQIREPASLKGQPGSFETGRDRGATLGNAGGLVGIRCGRHGAVILARARSAPNRVIKMRTGHLLALLLLWNVASAGQSEDALRDFFRKRAGLDDREITAVSSGVPVAKVLPTPTPAEILVFGAVYVSGAPADYLALAKDVDALRRLPGYLAIRRFSSPPQISDLEGFTLDSEDIKDLRECRPGDCIVQLPVEAIDALRRSVDWSAPDVAVRVNTILQTTALEALLAYQRGGNAALGTYRDQDAPAEIGKQFETLVERFEMLPVYLPDLRRFLLEYPSYEPPDVESQFYWEKVNFGLRPTLRLVHAAVYRGSGQQPVYATAAKQLYASHYFHTALDMTACIEVTGRPGFFLVTVKGSEQAGLTGVKGSMIRKVAVGKVRSSLEKALAGMKRVLEKRGSA
jgi:hypothetical protein